VGGWQQAHRDAQPAARCIDVAVLKEGSGVVDELASKAMQLWAGCVRRAGPQPLRQSNAGDQQALCVVRARAATQAAQDLERFVAEAADVC